MKASLRNVLVVMGLTVALAQAGIAQETKIGAVTFTRGAEVKGSYDSNIFLQPGQPLSATPTASGVASFTADLGFALDLQRTQGYAGYLINVLQYDKFPGVNNAVNQSATLWFTYGSGQQSSLGLADQFEITTDPASSELIERARRNQNDVIGNAEFGFGRDLFLGVDFQHELHDYLNASLGQLLNRTMIDVAPMFGYKPTEKTKVLARFTYEQVAYDDLVGQIKNNTGKTIEAEASGKFTSRLEGRVAAGVTMKAYETSVTKLTNSETLPAWKLSLTWAAPAEMTVSLMSSQATQEGLYNRFNVSLLNMVSANRDFGKRVNVAVFGMVINDAYPDLAPGAVSAAKRKDTTIQGGGTLAWSPKLWLTVSLSYLHRARNSNLDVFDYTDDVTSVGIGGTF